METGCSDLHGSSSRWPKVPPSGQQGGAGRDEMAECRAVGHYTYSETPLGDWLAATLSLQRNHYDRVVHFAFGLSMGRPVTELLASGMGIRHRYAPVLVLAVLMALGGGYEIIESWAARIVSPELGTAFLGTQGDPWDAQKDLTMMLVGAVVWLGGRVIVGAACRA